MHRSHGRTLPASRALAIALVASCSSSPAPGAPDVGQGRFGVVVSAPVTRYPITAVTIEEMRAEIRRDGPRVDGRRWAGATNWQLRWTYALRPDRLPGCRLANPNVYVTAAITMPEWIPSEEADDETRQWWRRYESGLMAHEAGHARLAVDAANALRLALPRLRAASCDALRREVAELGRRASEDLKARQAAYDAETRHGGTQIAASLRADTP